MRSQLLRIAVPLSVGLLACGVPSEDAPTLDEFAEAIPSGSMLALELDESAQGLTADTLPGSVRGAAHALVSDVRGLIEETHVRLGDIVALGTASESTRGRTSCKVWEYATGEAQFQLTSCRTEGQQDKYAFLLRGRALEATQEHDYRPLVAGEGRALPRTDAFRRGAGRIGYDFDALSALTGRDFGGKVGIGYRAAGRARQLVVALNGAHGELAEPTTTLFRYLHVAQRGGTLSFVSPGDFLALDGDGTVIPGQDDALELARTRLSWRADGVARSVATICGGTVLGCVRSAQCFSARGGVTHTQLGGDAAARPTWNAVQCGDIPFSIDEAPSINELSLPGASDALQTPRVDEPQPLANE